MAMRRDRVVEPGHGVALVDRPTNLAWHPARLLFLAYQAHAVEHQQGMQQIGLRAKCSIGPTDRRRVILPGFKHDMVHGAAHAAQVGLSADALGKVDQGLRRRLVQVGIRAVAGDLVKPQTLELRKREKKDEDPRR